MGESLQVIVYMHYIGRQTISETLQKLHKYYGLPQSFDKRAEKIINDFCFHDKQNKDGPRYLKDVVEQLKELLDESRKRGGSDVVMSNAG